MSNVEQKEIDHIYEAFYRVDLILSELIELQYFRDDPLEIRFRLVLEEKKSTIEKLLSYLKEEEMPVYSKLVEWVKIIYRDDEVEKLHFQGWKRICQQNNFLKEDKLEEMNDLFNKMSDTLEEALPDEEDFLREDHIPYVIPTLYRD
ncbi:hypothetical protein [Salibacterium aidingense]|uniref:hypothetical protein n=1 Tax=Salibacterium aidingense TaxID=384933 RepID=UPI00041FD904|nr:hypothetical protein [Salibacterium aidingense]